MTVMEESWQSAREVLARAAERAGYLAPSPVPLRLQREEGIFLSALPRLLAARTGGNAQTVAEELARACYLEGTAFSAVRAENGMMALSLSKEWAQAVLDRWDRQDWPELPPETEDMTSRSEEDGDFLLSYTIRRCRVLAQRPRTEPAPPLPAGLICARAEGRAEEAVIRSYWHLPYALRQYPPLAGAAGKLAGLIYRKFTPFPEGGV